jgi:hypothetical protein
MATDFKSSRKFMNNKSDLKVTFRVDKLKRIRDQEIKENHEFLIPCRQGHRGEGYMMLF